MTRIAGIDIGSNAIRIAIGELGLNGSVKILHTTREPIRLGGDVFEKGIISNALTDKALNAFHHFRELCDEYGVVLIRAVGTSALRDANNSEEFIQKVAAHSGIRVEVISGAKESQLIQLAVSKEVNLRRKLALLIDIGGGSTEVSLILNQKCIFSESHNVGAVRLLNLVKNRSNPEKLLARIVRSSIRGIKRSFQRKIGKKHISLCIGTGGNFEALATLRTSLLGKNGVRRFSSSDLDHLLSIITSLPLKKRILKLKLRPDRADVIVPAAITISEILKVSNVHEVLTPHVGLRDGLLHEAASHLLNGKSQIVRLEAIATARVIGAKYFYDKKHADTVVRYSLELFDKTNKLHKLSIEDRLILEVAAMLHDVGLFMGESDHHRHSSYIIRNSAWTGLDKKQVALVACVARYHRRTLPKRDHEIYKDLKQSEQERVKKLSALLRIADSLDRGRAARFRKLMITIKPGKLIIKVPNRADKELIKWAVDKKSDLFQVVFHRALELL